MFLLILPARSFSHNTLSLRLNHTQSVFPTVACLLSLFSTISLV
jgi:hypothetical protein